MIISFLHRCLPSYCFDASIVALILCRDADIAAALLIRCMPRLRSDAAPCATPPRLFTCLPVYARVYLLLLRQPTLPSSSEAFH